MQTVSQKFITKHNDLYIHYMDKSTGTPPSLEEKKALPNCGNKDGNIIHVLKKLHKERNKNTDHKNTD